MNQNKIRPGIIGIVILPFGLAVLIIAYIIGTINIEHNAHDFVRPAEALGSFTYEIEHGASNTATFPHSVKNLAPRTNVTVHVTVEPGQYECLLVKTVYTGLKLYADDQLIYECGQPGSYPAWLLDPPTMLKIVPLPDNASQLRFEYISPSQRSTMSVPAIMAGSDGSLLTWLFNKNAALLAVSIMLMFIGLVVILLTMRIWHGEKSGMAFFYLGIFSLSAGCWGFGECNATAFIVPNPIILYLMAMLGLFLMTVPLLRFALVVLEPRQPQVLKIASTLLMILVMIALGLQLLGIKSLSKTLFVFQLLEVFGLLLFFGTAVWEHFRYRNKAAKKFALPAFILFGASVIEYVNYSARFTNVLSLFFMVGTLLFTLGLGIIALQYSRDTLKEAEEKKRLAAENAALERMNQLKTDLMSTISHEARTPLAVLASYAGLVSMELQAKGENDEQISQDLDKIAFEAKRVAELIDSMKMMTLNIERSVERIPIQIGELIRQTMRLYQPILERAGVEQVIEIEEGLPPVIGNPDELTQIIFNLLQNTKNHTQKGLVIINVKSKDNSIITTIADTGSGISVDLLPHVFERGVSGTTGGSGLGLAICREIVEAHGGTIEIRSKSGEGTTVTFILPIA